MTEPTGRWTDDASAGAGTGPWPRFGARLIDGILLAVVGVSVGWAMNFNWLWLVLDAIFVYGYFVVCDVNFGRTIGKTVLGLRVSGSTSGTPNLEEAARREAWVLLGAIPFVGGLFSLVAAISIGVTINRDPAHQGWHDRFAGGTRVTKT